VACIGSSGTPSKGRLSKKQMMALKQSHSIQVTSSPARQTDNTTDDSVAESPGKKTVSYALVNCNYPSPPTP